MGDIIGSTPEHLCIRCLRKFTPRNPKTNDDVLYCADCKQQASAPLFHDQKVHRS